MEGPACPRVIWKSAPKGAWSIVIDLGRDPGTGKRLRIRRSVKGATKRQAEAEMRRLLSELEQGTYVEPSEITLDEYLRRWFEDTVQPRMTPKSIEAYSRAIEKHIIPALGKVPLEQLQPIQVQQFYREASRSGNRKTGGGLSPASMRLIHAVLRSALEQAVKWHMVQQNAAASVEAPRPRRPRLRVLDESEVGALLDAIYNPTLRDVVTLALQTGMRRGELLALRWSDVDLDRKVARVSRSLVQAGAVVHLQEPKTKSARRQVALPGSAVTLFRDIRKRQAERKLRKGPGYHDEDLVFTDPSGHQIIPRSISDGFSWAVKKAGFDGLRFHDLRHTHATLLLKQGVHPKVVQERLGHTSVTMTIDTYSHVLRACRRRQPQQMGGWRGDKDRVAFTCVRSRGTPA